MSIATGLGPVDQHREALAAIVDGIEREMRRIELWETTPPVPSRMASTQPFCFDTLRCHEWLQWQFLPRMRRIFEQGDTLPAESAIHPYARDCLIGWWQNPETLLFLIRTFDELISGYREPSVCRH